MSKHSQTIRAITVRVSEATFKLAHKAAAFEETTLSQFVRTAVKARASLLKQLKKKEEKHG